MVSRMDARRRGTRQPPAKGSASGPPFSPKSALQRTLLSARNPARWSFRLRAADRVEKWSPAGYSDSGKSSPQSVRLAGIGSGRFISHDSVLSVLRNVAAVLVSPPGVVVALGSHAVHRTSSVLHHEIP